MREKLDRQTDKRIIISLKINADNWKKKIRKLLKKIRRINE